MKKFLTILLAVMFGALSIGCQPRSAQATPIPEDADLVITVYAYEPDNEPNYGLLYLGHAFLSFENRSGAPVTIGALTLEDNETCSLGTWSMTHHFGIWYNVESNYIASAGRYGGRVSLSKEMPLDTLEAVNAYLSAHDAWSLFTNCSRFATEIFNLAGGDKIELGGLATPTKLAKRIRAYDTHETDRPIENYGKVGYKNDKGDFDEYVYAA